MTGHSGVQYDDDQQQTAVPKVIESWDAVTGSRKRTSALGSAQTSEFWGHEEGASAVQRNAADMFDAIAELLNLETEMLKDFEKNMHDAMARFTGAEYENELVLKEIQADQQAQRIREQNVTRLTALVHKLGFHITEADLQQGNFTAPGSKPPSASGGPAGGTSGGSPVTQPGQKKI